MRPSTAIGRGAMGGKGHGKGHGRGPFRVEEERWHARQVNAARAAEGLATKSTGSVSRSKARALAHRAAVDSKVIPVLTQSHF